MGGCAGCSVAAVLAVAYPEVAASMVLYSPAGGARYRIRQHERFSRHLAFVAERDLSSVAALAKASPDSFTQDPRVGPWVYWDVPVSEQTGQMAPARILRFLASARSA